MTNQTVKNMSFIILAMERQLEKRGFKELKTLTNSYETLLTTIDIYDEKFEGKNLINPLETQKKELEKLNLTLDCEQIPEMLIKEEFITVNNLTTTSAKLIKINEQLGLLLLRLYEKHNDRVLIISNDKNKAKARFEEEINNYGIKVFRKQADGLNSWLMMTDKDNYTVCEYNYSIRGRSYEFAYIDSKLDIANINIILSTLKDKQNYKMF